jgi:hypothetical protein
MAWSAIEFFADVPSPGNSCQSESGSESLIGLLGLII